MFGVVVNAGISLGLMVLLARMLGPHGFSDYSTLLNAAVIALVLLEGGIRRSITANGFIRLRAWRSGWGACQPWSWGRY